MGASKREYAWTASAKIARSHEGSESVRHCASEKQM